MNTVRVLLVEDNAITRRLIRLTLETQGIGVSEAPDGETALRLLALQPVDLVIQALLLPDIDGYELVARMRALPGVSETPVVAVTGFLSELDEARVSAVGFTDVITKPIEPARLLQTIRAHLPTDEPIDAAFGCGRRLIVVDDDPVQRKLLCFRLRRLGFDIIAVAGGTEALDIARRSPPDAIISDVMMPGLDGFGLCVAVREDAQLARTPLVLVTNSYVEDVDRDLARKAGANELVVRTPAMREIADALRSSLAKGAAKNLQRAGFGTNLEGEWSRRVVSQLERQVALNTGIAQRCATLSAELAILSGISDALAKQQHVDDALVHVLGACFDAGGISLGALYLRSEGRFRLHRFGAWGTWNDADIRTFFGHPELLATFIEAGKTVRIPDGGMTEITEVLRRAGMVSAILAPVARQTEWVGALLLGSTTINLDHEDRVLFIEGVATQIGQALTLSQAFADKDVSEKKSREQATVLRSILEGIAEGVVVTNSDNRVVLCNPAAEALLCPGSVRGSGNEWSPHEGLSFPDTLAPLSAEQSPFLRAIRGESVDHVELLVRNEGANPGKLISISARPLKDEADVVSGAVAVLRDVTVERATQTQLMVADRLASVGMLAAGVAHEINNPLAAVLGNLDFVLEKLGAVDRMGRGDPSSDDVRDPLRDARAGAVRIREIVRDLKVFSRAEEEEQGAVDVHNVIELSLRMASNEVRHRARVVRVYGDVPPVDGNESRLGQVFLNLIVNAAQAIPDGRANENEIRVTTRSDGPRRVIVDIADTGAGIRPEAMKRLFTPFFTTKPIGVGTGLGLSICHRLVAAAGGEITVESTLGKGTIFHVALRSTSASEGAAVAPSIRSALAIRRGRVLVIDDESAILNLVKRVLDPEHDCVGIANAKDAIPEILTGAYDVIFCDLMMPVMTGMDLYAELEAKAPDAARKIVFLTGGAFTERARNFLDQVANEHLEKPFEARTLRAIVGSRLRSTG